MKKLLTSLCLTGLLLACGSKESGTVKFVIGGQAFTAGSYFTGGIVIIMRNEVTLENVMIITTDEIVAEAKEFEVTRGDQWAFYGVGWDGNNGVDDGHGLEGTVKCSFHTQALVNDTEIITMNFSETNCLDEKFGKSNFKTGNQPHPLAIRNCAVNEEGACDPEVIATGRSYRLIIPTPGTFDPITGDFNPSLAIESDCYDYTSTTQEYATTNIKLPFVDLPADLVFPVAIELFDDPGCPAAPDEAFVFNRGPYFQLQPILNALNDQDLGMAASMTFSLTDGTHNYLHLPSNVCQNTRLTNLPFAHAGGAVETTSVRTNIICNANQLINMAANPNEKFALGADIDGGNTAWTSIPTFGGVFNGMEYEITNYNITGAANQIGFFGEVVGTPGPTYAEVKNLGLELIDVDANNQDSAGALAGRLGDYSIIENIYFDDISLTNGSNSAGGLIGLVDGIDTYLIDIDGRDGNLSGNTVDVSCTVAASLGCGGVIGSITPTGGTPNPTFMAIELDQAVVAGQNDVGGLAGRFTSTTLTASTHFLGMSVHNSTISGESRGGGAFGSTTRINLGDLSVINTVVTDDVNVVNRSFFGGAIGRVELSELSFINVQNGGDTTKKLSLVNNVTQLGGGIGLILDSNLFALKVDYFIEALANAELVGGAIGEAQINDPYSIAGVASSSPININTVGTNGNIGGLVGRATNTAITFNSPTFSESFANANITIQNFPTATNIGGFAGSTDSVTLARVGAEGNINITAGTGQYIGGLIGSVNSTYRNNDISNSYTQVAINDTGTCSYLGGLYGNSNNTNATTFTNIYAASTIATSGINTGFEGFASATVNADMFFNGVVYASDVGTSSLAGNTAGIFEGVPLATLSNIANHSTYFPAYQIGVDSSPWYSDTNSGLPEFYWYNAMTSFISGTGSYFDPYHVETAAHFNNIGRSLLLNNAHFVQTQNIDFGGGVINPVGTATNPFSGSYRVYSGDLMLRNGTINLTGFDDVGIFRNIKGAHIGGGFDPSNSNPNAATPPGNLVVSDITINGANNVGALIGHIENYPAGQSHVEHVRSVNNTINATGNKVGGIIGDIIGRASLNNMVNETFINLTASTNVGGIVGSISATSHMIPVMDIQNLASIDVYDGTNIGGIAGHAQDTIFSDVYNQAGISAGGVGAAVGGIAGRAISSYTIIGHYRLANVGGVSGADDVGGLFGVADVVNYSTNIYKSYSRGSVSSSGGTANTGGMVGRAQGTNSISFTESYVYLSSFSPSTGAYGLFTGSGTATVAPNSISFTVTGTSTASGGGESGTIAASEADMNAPTTYTSMGWSLDGVFDWKMNSGDIAPTLEIERRSPLYPFAP